MPFPLRAEVVRASFLSLFFCIGCASTAPFEEVALAVQDYEPPETLPVGLEGAPVFAHPADVNNGVGYRLYEQADSRGELAPLVIYIGGSEGGFPTHRDDVPTVLLGAGFSVATIGYFDFEGGPSTLAEISVDAIIEQIESSKRSYKDGYICTGVIGVSKGAELTLFMASQRKVADAYVAAAPSSVVWQASEVTLRRRSSWVQNGAPVPYLKYPWFSKGTVGVLMGRAGYRAIHTAGLNRERSAAKAAIAVELVEEPVLLMSARQDHVWPSYEMALAIMERLGELNPSHRFQHTAYERDHYLFDDRNVILDAVNFLDHKLRNSDCR